MSAFVVTKDHIAAIVRFACSTQRGRDCLSWSGFEYQPGQLAGLLYAENVKSVNHRYPNEMPEEPIAFTDLEIARALKLGAVEAIKACHCLAYQSCEHPGWEKSRAKQVLDSIESYAISMLPGYDAAPWSIDNSTKVGQS